MKSPASCRPSFRRSNKITHHKEKRLVMKIEGSVALVTGANRGLGKALVSALVEAGAAKVYAAARDARTVSADSSRIVPLTLDVTKPEQIAAAALKAGDVTLIINTEGGLNSFNV